MYLHNRLLGSDDRSNRHEVAWGERQRDPRQRPSAYLIVRRMGRRPSLRVCHNHLLPLTRRCLYVEEATRRCSAASSSRPDRNPPGTAEKSTAMLSMKTASDTPMLEGTASV